MHRIRNFLGRILFGRAALPHEPTERQGQYARFLAVTIPKDCTRRELSRLIDRALKG